jgi:hypothetical protein
MNLGKNVKVTVVVPPLADGQGTSNSTGLDMSGFDGVLYIGTMGVITGSGTNTLTAQDSADNSTFSAIATPSAIASTCNASASTNCAMVLNVHKPLKRYQRVALVRGAANSIGAGVIAIQYTAKEAPTTHDATTVPIAMGFAVGGTS